jgi:hypothetical protein
MSEIVTRQQFWGTFKPKKAEAAGTNVMPHGAPTGKDKAMKHTIPKIGSIASEPEGVEPAVKGEQAPQNPQTKQLNPRVNVESKEPPKAQEKKEASAYALPGLKRYPLDNYADVEKAASYFEDWGRRFEPRQRREYCANLVKRASVLGVPLNETIRKYGSASRAPAEEIAMAIDARKGVVTDQTYSAALTKLAEDWPAIPSELLVEVLSQFDKTAGIDHLYGQEIPDPYWSVYGEKVAQEDTHVLGNEIVSDNQLKLLAKQPGTNRGLVDLFGKDFAQEFKEDPVGIFKSLPMDQKKILARMANDILSP